MDNIFFINQYQHSSLFIKYYKMMKKGIYDHLAKIIIIGEVGVGKTNILLRYCQDRFAVSHTATIGIDLKMQTVEVDGVNLKLQIWDTAGQEKYKTITKTFLAGANGVIMTYSLDNISSFQSLENWLKQIHEISGEDIPKIILANKCDLPNRKIGQDELKQMANSFGVQYFQVSAKENINITEAFTHLARDIKNRFEALEAPLKDQKPSITLRVKPQGTTQSAKRKKNCC